MKRFISLVAIGIVIPLLIALFKSHLASHGFVMVIVQSPGFSYQAPWNNAVIDAPLDFFFVLDELDSNPPEGLETLLDTN